MALKSSHLYGLFFPAYRVVVKVEPIDVNEGPHSSP